MPSLLEKYKKDIEKASTDIPVLESTLSSTWRKEDELKELKTELQALDRKIQLSLKPIEQSEGVQEDEIQQSRQPEERSQSQSQLPREPLHVSLCGCCCCLFSGLQSAV